MKRSLKPTIVAMTMLALAACSTAGGKGANVTPAGAIKPRQISWLLSRPADGGVVTVMSQLAAEYAKTHPGFSLKLISTPDRPSYIQKYETLAAANKLPDLFDTDSTPCAQELAKQCRRFNGDKLLKYLVLDNSYRPYALNYHLFYDVSLYMI